MDLNARLWVLNLSDGEHSLLDIAERSQISFSVIRDAAELLCQSGLLSVVSADESAKISPHDTSAAAIAAARRSRS